MTNSFQVRMQVFKFKLEGSTPLLSLNELGNKIRSLNKATIIFGKFVNKP